MRILLDEQLPRQLAPYFFGHDVRTTQEQGWAGLVAPTNKLEDLLPRVPGALEAIARARPGEIERVGI